MTFPLAGSTRTVSGPRANPATGPPRMRFPWLERRSLLICTDSVSRSSVLAVEADESRPSASVTQAAPPPVAMPPGVKGSFVVESTL